MPDSGALRNALTIGVFGGSFNPVHNGHIGLAEAMVSSGLVDRVWLVLSPRNPLKAAAADMAPDNCRMDMLRLACGGRAGLEACGIELTMPRPSYTADTMRELTRRYPQVRFRLVVGADNMMIFDRWREHDYLLEHFAPIVYPRPGYACEGCAPLPVFDVSGTEIRRRIALGEPVNNLVCPAVLSYIRAHGLYGA